MPGSGGTQLRKSATAEPFLQLVPLLVIIHGNFEAVLPRSSGQSLLISCSL